MFVIVNRIPGQVIKPESLIDFGRQESYNGDTYYRGQSGETTVVIISQTDCRSDIETAAERILTSHPIRLVVYVGLATPLVPYLQQGDLVVADRILAWPGDDNVRPDEIILPEDETACVSSEPELVGGVFAVYENLCAGKSNRPQMIIGSVISGNYQPFEKHAAADLHQRYGVIVGDKSCLAIARIARAQDIRFLYLGMVYDGVSDQEFVTMPPISAGHLTAVLRQFIQTRPIATIAPVAIAQP
jgi:nucleoside phosphorylase